MEEHNANIESLSLLLRGTLCLPLLHVIVLPFVGEARVSRVLTHLLPVSEDPRHV